MLHSIGYQYLNTTSELVNHLMNLNVTVLIDVRSKPYSRKRGFGKNQIKSAIEAAGIRYVWKGEVLGGMGKIADESIQALADWQKDQNACLMCMEGDPDKCHRKYEIGARLAPMGVDVNHIIT